MTELQVNVPLLRKAVEWVEQEDSKPEGLREWYQNAYVVPAGQMGSRREAGCGTCYCVAGFVGQVIDERYANTDQVEGVHVADFAAAELGIDPDEAGAPGGLFYDSNTADDVRKIAEDLAGERL